MKINILNLEKKLKIKVKNKSLFIEALTHKSSNSKVNNEKLEFLGDRVIGLILSKKLYDLYPNENEGILDKRFAKLVNKKTCCNVGWSMGVQNFIIIGDSKKKITKKDEKILSDACEAIIGAVYIDKGFNFATEFVENLWKEHLISSNITVLDPKTRLQEHSLKKYKKLPIYKLLNSQGPRHNPTFKVSVSITESKIFYGTGKSIQKAEQDGAYKLLKGTKLS